MKLFLSYLLGQNKLPYSNKLLPFNMKPINLMEKYPHITELYACILKIIVVTFLLSINILISFEICSNLKLLKYLTLLHSHTKLSNDYLLIYTHKYLLHMCHAIF